MFHFFAYHPAAFLALVLLLVAFAAVAATLVAATRGLAATLLTVGVLMGALFTTLHQADVAHEDILRGTIQDKYGPQVTRVGDTGDIGDDSPITSTWEIDGTRTSCSVDTRDLDDPFVSCGTALPLAER